MTLKGNGPWVLVPGKGLVPKAELRPKPRVHIISDQVDLKSMADGQHYDSKSRYYKSLKAQGYEIRGDKEPNLTPREYEPKGIGEAIAQTMREKGYL